MKPIKYNPDTYLLYGVSNPPYPSYPARPNKQPQKQPKFKIPEFPSKIVEDVYKAIKLNRKAKYSWLADNLGVSERTIQRAIDDLKSARHGVISESLPCLRRLPVRGEPRGESCILP